MTSEDEAIRQTLVQLRIYEGSARALEARLEIVNAAMNEYAQASSTLEGVGSQTVDAQTLIPVGGGSFVRARLADISKIVMGVGAGVAMEKPIEDSINDLKSRVADLEKARESLQNQLTQTLLKIEEDRGKLNEIVRKRGGDSVVTL